MKRYVASVVSIAAIGIVGLAGSASAHPGGMQNTASAAFGSWIRQHFPNPQGDWTCPQAQINLGRVPCLGEFRVGHEWHKVSANAVQGESGISIIEVVEHRWKRKWTPYYKWIIRGFGTPGKASVNGVPAADWPFLALGAYSALHRRHSATVIAYDGNSTGFNGLVAFRCRSDGGLIKCKDKLGDAMRFRPHA